MVAQATALLLCACLLVSSIGASSDAAANERQQALRRLMKAGPDAFKAAKPELFNKFDADADGHLDKAEYQRFIKAFAAEHQIRSGRPEAEALEHAVGAMGLEESYAQGMQRYDTDASGGFDADEWEGVIDDAADETL